MLTRALVLGFVVVSPVELLAQDESYEYQERDVVETTVEEVMARPEFRRLAGTDDEVGGDAPWLERILDGIVEWIEEWLTGTSSRDSVEVGSAATYLMYAIAFVIVVAALAFIVKTVLESSNERELASEDAGARLTHASAAPGETAPEEFWNRAHALAASGNEKLAIRELLLGAMSSLERRGLIRYRRGLTNRDYLWAAPAAARSSLATITTAFERVYFGRRAATSESFRECADAYRESFSPSGPAGLDTETA